ncbi:MAG: TorF family putative porin, partial [Pseudomonadota bacterium]
MQQGKNVARLALLAAVTSAAISAPTFAGDLTANASVTNNYIWRGLTQTENESAVQGGIDYAADSGFYVGTWVSNVNYGAGDVYSYEHDIYG